MKKEKKQIIIKTSIIVLETVAGLLILYLVALPFYPTVKYKLNYKEEVASDYRDEQVLIEQTTAIRNFLPQAEYDVSPNRVIIPRIGVNAPIVESASSEYGLSKGSWLVPDTSTPDKGGNTVITGHRFKYLPPNNLTFYLFHKLEVGDLFSVIWHNEDYYYRIKEVKIVDKTELSIMEQTSEPVITLFTCHPIYSTEQRLVVVGELVEQSEEI